MMDKQSTIVVLISFSQCDLFLHCFMFKHFHNALTKSITYSICVFIMYHGSGNRDRPCFFETPNITYTQTQTGEVTTKAMKALEVYLVMLLVP